MFKLVYSALGLILLIKKGNIPFHVVIVVIVQVEQYWPQEQSFILALEGDK